MSLPKTIEEVIMESSLEQKSQAMFTKGKIRIDPEVDEQKLKGHKIRSRCKVR